MPTSAGTEQLSTMTEDHQARGRSALATAPPAGTCKRGPEPP
jgi:hypothetical protein